MSIKPLYRFLDEAIYTITCFSLLNSIMIRHDCNSCEQVEINVMIVFLLSASIYELIGNRRWSERLAMT